MATGQNEGEAKLACPSAKARHASEEDAKWAARIAMLDGAPDLNVYWCLFCSGWHLTSKAPRTNKRGKAKQ